MPSNKTYLSPEDQYAATLAHYWSVGIRQEASQYGDFEIELAEARLRGTPCLGDFPCLAIIQRPHRLFLPGDLVVFSINNGNAERYPVWSVSSKGFKVSGLYMHFYRFHRGRQLESGLLKRVWRPGDSVPAENQDLRLSLDHPAAKKYLADLAVRETLPHR